MYILAKTNYGHYGYLFDLYLLLPSILSNRGMEIDAIDGPSARKRWDILLNGLKEEAIVDRLIFYAFYVII